MSFFCSKPDHSSFKLTMVCLDPKCSKNESICHYCLFEHHPGHQIVPLELFLDNFQSKLAKNPQDIDLLKLKARVSCFDEIKDKYLEKLNEFQEVFNSTLGALKSRLKGVFGPESELTTLQKAYQILNLAKSLERGLPEVACELQTLISVCLKLVNLGGKENFEDGSLFDLKSINNGLDLSISRLNTFDMKLGKIIQKTLKSLDSDFKFILNQISLDNILLLKEVPDPEQSVLEGHRNYIRRIVSLGISNNSPLLASCSQDGQIRVWNLLKNTCIAVLTGHKGQIYDLIFLESQQILISASQDHTIKLWKVGTWNCLRTLYGNEGWVGHLVFNQKNNMLSSGGSDRKVRMWCIESGKCKTVFNGTDSEIFSLENGEWEGNLMVIAGDIRGKIYFFNCSTQNLNPEKKVNAHNDKILRLKFYKSKEKGKKVLISCSNDKTIKIWNVKSMDLLKNLEIHTHFVTDFYFDEKNEVLISCSFDNMIKMISLKSYEVLATWKVNHHLINITWVPIANMLCTSSTSNNEFGIYIAYF